MRIADLLIPTLTSLSRDEQLELVLTIRERRRFVAKPARVAKAVRSKKDSLTNMTKEQLEKLLEVLTR